MAFAFYSCERNQNLYVAFPINLAVVAVWWMQDRWARSADTAWRHAPEP